MTYYVFGGTLNLAQCLVKMLQLYCTAVFHFTQVAHNRECTVSCSSYFDFGIYIGATL